MVVNYSYRDRDLKRVRKYFHFASVVGFALAFAGIPYYDNFIWLCQIPSIPIIETYRYMFIFVFYPIVIAILGSGVAISLVFLKVRKVSQASKRWLFSYRGGNTGGGVGGKMARKVFWQAFFFLLALYGTWPLLMIAEFSSKNVVKIYEHHWVWQLTLALAPLQGFFNFFVYTRPKIMSYLRQLFRKRERQAPTTPKPRNMSWARKGMRVPLRVEMPSESSSNDEKKGRPREVPPMLDDDDDHSEDGCVDVPPKNHSIEVTESTGLSLARRRMQMPSSGEGSQAETLSSIGKSPLSDVDADDDSDILTTHESGQMPSSVENEEESKSHSDGTAKTDSNSISNSCESDEPCGTEERNSGNSSAPTSSQKRMSECEDNSRDNGQVVDTQEPINLPNANANLIDDANYRTMDPNELDFKDSHHHCVINEDSTNTPIQSDAMG